MIKRKVGKLIISGIVVVLSAISGMAAAEYIKGGIENGHQRNN